MKITKKIANILLIFVLLFTMLFIPSETVQAKSINSLRQDVERIKKEQQENANKKALNESQRRATEANVALIDANIKKGEQEQIRLTEEIIQLEKDIKEKEAEIEKIVNFLQVSESNSIYLDYIFGAEDFTDLIYRVAVTEQLSKYNADLVTKFSEMVESNKVRKEELTAKEKELKAQQVTLQAEIAKLAVQANSLNKTGLNLADALKKQEAMIRDYKTMGCRDDEELTACLSRLNSLPPDTEFWRPLNSGTMTSEFGWRTLWGSREYHYGIDIGAASGSPIYAAANGSVATTFYHGSTGNTVILHHLVGGKKYTTMYFHMSSIGVKKGQVVTKNSVIGRVGSTGNSTGAHLHLEMLHGLVGADYVMWSSSHYNNVFNPRTKVNFPKAGGYFNNRTSYYK